MKAKHQTQKNIETECCSHQPQKIHQRIKQAPFYGKPTKLRCQEPSMFEILTWKDSNSQKQFEKNSNQNHICLDDQNYGQEQIRPNEKREQYYQKVNNGQNCKKRVKLNMSQGVDQKSQQFSFRNGLKGNIPNKSIKQVQSLKNLDIKKNLVNFQNSNIQKTLKNTKINKQLNENMLKTKASSTKLIKTNFKTLTRNTPKARYLSPKSQIRPNIDQETIQKLRKDALKKFKQTTRDLSNSAYLTYFNKPPFQTYGRGNTHNPGVLYGDYMYSHNIIPHTGDNKPKNQQTYQTALIKAKSSGNLHPHPPLTKFQYGSSMTYHTVGQIYPSSTKIKSFQINKIDIQKLPKFTASVQNEENKRDYYIKEKMVSKPQFLTSEQIQQKLWKSNKDDIDGRQIIYQKKIGRIRKNSFQY